VGGRTCLSAAAAATSSASSSSSVVTVSAAAAAAATAATATVSSRALSSPTAGCLPLEGGAIAGAAGDDTSAEAAEQRAGWSDEERLELLVGHRRAANVDCWRSPRSKCVCVRGLNHVCASRGADCRSTRVHSCVPS
jgi:hypothetical protein